MLFIERLDLEDVDWHALDALPDRTIHQTRPWLEFLKRTQGAEPVVAALVNGDERIGYFTGAIVRKFGLRILGSPFKGWSTDYMGFNLLSEVYKAQALTALKHFAFEQLECVYFEIVDRHLSFDDVDGNDPDLEYSSAMTYEVDLTQPAEVLLANMNSDRRRCIRRAQEKGVFVEEAHDIEFAEDYYAQLQDVFAKQSLVPTYGIERVHELIRCIHPTGMLLLLRVKDPEGNCIATGIFPAMNDTAYFWGAAAWRKDLRWHPHEPMHWYAMNYWKTRGIKRYDFGGGGEYKKKYGGYKITVPRFVCSKYALLKTLRNTAQRAVSMRQRLVGRFRHPAR